MYVHTRLVSKLPRHIYVMMYRLNYGSDGLMRSLLVNNKDSRVFWIEDCGQVVSWAICTIENGWKTYDANFWTKSTHRRRGYARRILNEMTKKLGKVTVHPHSDNAASFFNHVDKKKIRRIRY